MNGAVAPTQEKKRTTHYRYRMHLITVCLLAPPQGARVEPCVAWRESTENPDRCTFLYPSSQPDNCLGVCDYCVEFSNNIDNWIKNKNSKLVSPMRYMWGKSYKRKDYPK